ncbi:MAG: FliG C-terminal domain-containing protein [Planctomycetota bacterium]
MASEGDPKIRRIAIVLQSMDADTVRKLLGQFPADMARAIRRAFSNLGTVSPTEGAAAAQELQNLLGKTANTKIEHNPASQVLHQGERFQDAIQWSPEARRATDSHEPIPNPGTMEFSTNQHASLGSSGRRWLNVPPATLAQILEKERPTVVAAVLQELPVVMATAVLQLLPIPTATETMVAMPHLHRNDPAILDELLHQISSKVEETLRSEQKTQIGLEKLKAIVAHAPDDQKLLWATNLGSIDPQLPAALGWNRTPQRLDLTSMGHSPQPANPASQGQFEPDPLKKLSVSSSTESEPQSPTSETLGKYQSLDDLMTLEDADFVEVLQSVEPKTVLRALAGADRKFLKRFERLMPKKDLPRLRQRINQLKDVSLRDIDHAHLEILQSANSLDSEGRIGVQSIRPFSTAA